MKKLLFVLMVAWLGCTVLADTLVVEGASTVQSVRVKSGDTVKVESVDTKLTVTGDGDVFHIDGSDNRIEVQGSFKGMVITGTNNTVEVKGDLPQLDVRGSDNVITLRGRCDLVQYSGVDNKTYWVKAQGRKPPKVEREGFDNLFEVREP